MEYKCARKAFIIILFSIFHIQTTFLTSTSEEYGKNEEKEREEKRFSSIKRI